MDRSLIEPLKNWLQNPDRKPLVLRGARQVGKTWLIRHLAEISAKQLIEINFEKRPADLSLFNSNEPAKILLNLSAARNQQIDPENCLLFLDEIQAGAEIFAKLRWFAEDLPQLPVVCAGSLLDFLLAEHSFNMPVGRISYMYLEPLSFEEFLLAQNKKLLRNYLTEFSFSDEIPASIHQQLSSLFKEYLLIGGLPAAVVSWVKEQSLMRVSQIQNDLLATYRDDFSKYKGRLPIERLEEVMRAVPKILGQKFVYKQVNASASPSSIKQAVDLLAKARICNPVICCSANGLPLGAETKEKYFKEVFLDTGLCSVALGLSLTEINEIAELTLINNGGLAEQVVGQLLRTINPPYMEPALYYWIRDEKGSSAELDYVIQQGSKLIPIEVKAGSTGSLKSLHLFMGLKKLSLAVRINSDFPSLTAVRVKDRVEGMVEYKLLSIPFYLTGQLSRLLNLQSF